MSQFMALGMTHYPMLAGTDEHMAGLLRWTLQDEDIPAEEKDPANWPERMRKEWGADEGRSAAAAHRRELVGHLRRCRAALDDFAPDHVVVWGDDQYENFREDVVPPFCVLAYGDLEVPAFEVMNERGSPNQWGLPDDFSLTLHGDAPTARKLADGLINDGFDMAYSYRKRPGAHFPHAILNTQLFLDYDHAGAEMPYKLLPVTVNCYGQHAIARKGGPRTLRGDRAGELGPRRTLARPVHRARPRHRAAFPQLRRAGGLRRLLQLVARLPDGQAVAHTARHRCRPAAVRPDGRGGHRRPRRRDRRRGGGRGTARDPQLVLHARSRR